MIYVQHLLGIGHLNRSIQLANALAEQAFSVEIVSGGMPQSMSLAQGVHLTQLPPVRSQDGSFKLLLDEHDNAISSSWKENRKSELLGIYQALSPAVLITETFPFGRRMMRFELMPLLKAAKLNPSTIAIVASIRDILQPKSKPGRNEEICDIINQSYDHVLVHGDETIATLDDSFPLAHRIQDKISYTGYICNNNGPKASANEGFDEVIVSAGGSATGLHILKTAIAVKSQSEFDHLTWRILVSPAIDNSDYQALKSSAGDGVIVERNRSDFGDLIARARLSISQAGYNTMTDLLKSDTAAIVVPYSESEEIEQTIRARLLHQRSRVIMIDENELSSETLSIAIRQSTSLNTEMASIKLDGARQAAKLIDDWYNRNRTGN